jgi:hypothetical protein
MIVAAARVSHCSVLTSALWPVVTCSLSKRECEKTTAAVPDPEARLARYWTVFRTNDDSRMVTVLTAATSPVWPVGPLIAELL